MRVKSNEKKSGSLMIINKSGIAIRMPLSECRIMGRATQGVRLINLQKKNDVIASVCKVMSSELESTVEEESRNQWAQRNDIIRNDAQMEEPNEEPFTPMVDFEDETNE